MAGYSRREFIGSGAAMTAAFGFGLPVEKVLASAPQEPSDTAAPDLVLLNGRVFTIDNAQPRAEAFAVKNGRFIAVGSSNDIRPLVMRNTEVVDAEGMTVTPGFIDAHSHPSGAGVSELIHVNVDLRSISEIKEALRDRASITPEDQWVIGFKYDDTKLREGRPLNRTDLDEAVPRNPVMVRHRGGHTAVYNSQAFGLAGVTAETPDPEGGAFYRENGELTGRVAERGRNVFDGLIPSGSTREQRQVGVRLISELMTKSGLTSVHQTGGSTDDMIAYQDARAAGEMRFRMYLFPRGGLYRNLKEAGVRTGFGDEWIRIGAVKYAADGSASERTMRMSTPYVGRPDDYGILTMSQEEIHEVAEDAHRSGFQIAIHANGDVTIDMVLNAYERVGRLWPRPDSRHRIEHCSLVNPDLLERIKGRRRHSRALLHLHPLSRQQVGGVRAGEDALDVRAPIVSGLRHSSGTRIRLHTRTV